MKPLLLFCLLGCCILFCNAQSQQDVDSVLYYANHFNDLSNREGKDDSAAFLLKRLAIFTPKTFPDIFSETADNSFSQRFIKFSKDEMRENFAQSDSALNSLLVMFKEQRNTGKKILNKVIRDTNSLIQKYLTPLKYWVDEQNLIQKINQQKI